MIKIIFASLIYLAGLVYFLAPAKSLPVLTDAALSDEPGDTWQNPDQKGYYTNLTRGVVLSQIQEDLQMSVFGIPLPSYRLNYRPEDAPIIIRDQLQSNYMEEIVYPLHNSVYVNGWEPKKSPMYAGKPAKEIPDISIHGVAYDAKITLKPVNSTVSSRLFIWTSIFPLTYLCFLSLKRSTVYG